MKKQIILNVLTGYAGNAVSILLGIFLVPFLIHKLGTAAFGITVLAESIIATMEVLSVSLRTSLSRYLTFCLYQKNENDFLEYVTAARRFLLFLTFGMLLTAAPLCFLTPKVFSIVPALMAETQIMFFLMSLAFILNLPVIIFWAVLYANQRFDLINISNSSARILRAIMLFAAFSLLPQPYVSLTTYGAVYLFIMCTQNFFVYLWYRKIMPLPKKAVSFAAGKIKDLLSFSFYTAFNNISTTLYQALTQIMINVWLGPTANAIYAVGTKFSVTLRNTFQETAWTLTPSFTAYAASNDREHLRWLLFSYVKFSTLVLVPICLFLIIFSEAILKVWVGEKFMLAAPIMTVQLVVLALSCPLCVTGCLFNAFAKVKIPTIMSFFSTIGLVISSYIAIKVFHGGLQTLNWIDALTIFTRFAITLTYVPKISGISLKDLVVKNFMGPALWAAVFWGSIFLLIKHWGVAWNFTPRDPHASWAAALVVTGLILYAITAFFLLKEKGSGILSVFMRFLPSKSSSV